MSKSLLGQKLYKKALVLAGLLTLLLATSSCLNDLKNIGGNDEDSWMSENPKILPAIPYKMDSPPTLIQGAKIYTAAGNVIPSGDILMEKGRLVQVSEKSISVAADATVIDGKGLVATPGLIDVHSHMGVYPHPQVDAHMDGNEMVRPVTADVWAEHGFWPQDPALWRALALSLIHI